MLAKSVSDPRHLDRKDRFLILDDDPIYCDLLSEGLRHLGMHPIVVHDIASMCERVQQDFFSTALIDFHLQGENGFDAVDILTRESPCTRIVMMSADDSTDLAVGAMRHGAANFVPKTTSVEQLLTGVLELVGGRKPLSAVSVDGAEFGILGASNGIRDVLTRIHQLRNILSTVLITGESGTGKELVARALHHVSPRAQSRFEGINCGAIPENLLESELFGYRRGAFTDAKGDHKGLLEVCSEGTLFLDEVAELPLALQVKLLRVLQEREFSPLGSTSSMRTEARILAATNKNLSMEVAAGRFREDLYYRLAVLQIRLPPLRERRSDIPRLLEYFVHDFNRQFGRAVRPPSSEDQARLVAYDWPGNIRELRNAVERGVVLATESDLVLDTMLEPEQLGAKALEIWETGAFYEKSLSEAKFQFERAYLDQLLKHTRGNISEMARISGRYRADIYRLLIKHELEWHEFRTG